MYRAFQFRLWHLLAMTAGCGLIVSCCLSVVAQLPGTINQLPPSEQHFVQQLRAANINIVDKFT